MTLKFVHNFCIFDPKKLYMRNPEVLSTSDRCKIVCDAAYAQPEYVNCLLTGWDYTDSGQHF